MTVTAIIAQHSRFLGRSFWRDYAITMRPYLLFVSGITGIAGLSLASDVSLAAAITVGLVLFLSYGFGQAVTDCFQTDTDRLSAPYRPLVRGTVARRDILLVSFGGLLVGGAVVVAFNPRNALAAGLTIVGLSTYTWFKRRWWAGPWYNAWIVSLLVLIGYQAGAGAGGETVVHGTALFGIMFAALAAYANFVLTGYYKDIAADRATGYRTFPVAFGRRAGAWVSDGFAVLAFVGAGIALTDVSWDRRLLAAAAFLIGAALLAGVAQWRLHHVRTDADAHRAIEPVVHAYILLLAGLAAANQPGWAPFLIGFYVAFVWTVKHRPTASQI
jgi:4-hydroxybenzoate polyprenyltransferase